MYLEPKLVVEYDDSCCIVLVGSGLGNIARERADLSLRPFGCPFEAAKGTGGVVHGSHSVSREERRLLESFQQLALWGLEGFEFR
jgi:hypothetical protein